MALNVIINQAFLVDAEYYYLAWTPQPRHCLHWCREGMKPRILINFSLAYFSYYAYLTRISFHVYVGMSG